MIPRVSLREALSDPNLLGTAIAGDSWQSWRALLIAAMGESLTEDERAIFIELTGRVREPAQRVNEFVAVIGRRGGKSRAMAVLATYIAGLCDHTDALAPGERGILLCVALDQKVAKIILDYAQACFEHSPILRQLIKNRTADALELTNSISCEVPARELPQAARANLRRGDRGRAGVLVYRVSLRQPRRRNPRRSAPCAADDARPADPRQFPVRQDRCALEYVPQALRPRRRTRHPRGPRR